MPQSLPRRKPSMQWLTIDEIKAILKEIPLEWQRTMILVALSHGLRVSEVLRLRKEDIQYGRIIARRRKNSLTTVQPYMKSIDPDLNESDGLKQLAKTLAPGELVFKMSESGFAKLMKRAGARAGIDPWKLHPHALKHSCARLGLKNGMTLPQVQMRLGHRSIGSTAAYTRVDDEEAAEAFMGAF